MNKWLQEVYLWSSPWWCPLDIWWKKKTSFSCHLQVGRLSSPDPSGGGWRRDAWEAGAPSQTPLWLTCSFSEPWWENKQVRPSSPTLLETSAPPLTLPQCLHVLHPLWRTSSSVRWAVPRYTGNRCSCCYCFLRRHFEKKNSWKKFQNNSLRTDEVNADWKKMCFCISGLVSFTRADGVRLRAAGHSLSARMQWKHPPQGAVSEHC